MLSLGLSLSFIALSSSVVLARWLDLKSIRVIALVVISFDLIVSLFMGYYNFILASQISLPIISSWGIGKRLFLLAFGFDSLSSAFLLVLFIALILCLLFLGEYFEYDTNGVEICLLSSIFSQLAFIFFCTRDLITMLFFWEWISIVSFFLVKFWSSRVSSLKAALKVFCISQFGDFFFILGVAMTMSVLNSAEFSLLNSNVIVFWGISLNVMGLFSLSLQTTIGLTMTAALLLKSAQGFFYPWLLDAMEAPVPISAQLHSSTLVIIGFYAYLRFLPIFRESTIIQGVLISFGASTAVGASVLGFFQTDGKRLLACSTASQLGYVVSALGLGLIDEGVVLLLFCCCNKAYTFVWFGCLMNKSGGLSDFRAMGGAQINLVERAGLITASLNVTISMGAFAWHVKGLLARGLLNTDHQLSILGFELIALTWFLTLIYMSKLVLFVSGFSNKTPQLVNRSAIGETNLGLFFVQLVVLFVLVSFSVFGALTVLSIGAPVLSTPISLVL